MAGASSRTLRVRLGVPDDPSGLYYIAFAVRGDLDPAGGLTAIEEYGTVTNARGAFNPEAGTERPALTIGDGDYRLYVTRDAWFGSLIGLVDWTLR